MEHRRLSFDSWISTKPFFCHSLNFTTTAPFLKPLFIVALGDPPPAIVIVELGANDGLRGLPLDTTRSNLEAIMSLAAAKHRSVVLAGMRMPPNYGERYTLGFAGVFPALARLHHAALVPFLLEGVADRPALMQADGLHPNERGQAVVLDNVWPVLRPLLQKRQL